MSDGAGQGLSRVVLAISAYRSDGAVIRLLEQVFADGSARFGTVIVVDSLSSGAIAEEIDRRGWPVQFDSADTNLGSAGNLARRLELASACDAEWCYAVNHDGEIDPDAVLRLLAAAQGRQRIGAVYPARIYPNRGGTWESGQRSLVPWPLIGRATRPAQGIEELTWSSSNGALYSLAAVRAGLHVWADLWMGWEDLAFGWLMHRNGWRQLRSNDAVFTDLMEYRPVRIAGRTAYITDKPAWYSYYHARNLILISRRSGRGVAGFLLALARIAQEAAITVLWRGDTWQRLRLLTKGSADGMLGKSGKGPVP